MDRKKQIDEMLNDLCEADKEFYEFCRGKRCQECEYYCPNCYPKKDCKNKLFAEKLTEKGYRKASEVALQVIGEIEEATNNHIKAISMLDPQNSYCAGGKKALDITLKVLAELKKKYIGEEK